jgi:hypothetical protein
VGGLAPHSPRSLAKDEHDRSLVLLISSAQAAPDLVGTLSRIGISRTTAARSRLKKTVRPGTGESFYSAPVTASAVLAMPIPCAQPDSAGLAMTRQLMLGEIARPDPREHARVSVEPGDTDFCSDTGPAGRCISQSSGKAGRRPICRSRFGSMRGDLSAGGCAPVLESIEEAEAAPHGQNPSIRPHLRSGQAQTDLMSNKLATPFRRTRHPTQVFGPTTSHRPAIVGRNQLVTGSWRPADGPLHLLRASVSGFATPDGAPLLMACRHAFLTRRHDMTILVVS